MVYKFEIPHQNNNLENMFPFVQLLHIQITNKTNLSDITVFDFKK